MLTVSDQKPQQWQTISCLNWKDSFPYAPEVRFRMWLADELLHIEYEVSEASTKAEQTILGGSVHMDSCVEFFIQPDALDPHYYNFEWNAAGMLSMSCRTGRADAQRAPLDVIRSVQVFPSLGTKAFAEKDAGTWTLEVAIPASSLFNSSLDGWSGKTMRMNLYKCGDGLRTPHYVSWQAVDTQRPDFHRPEFFAPVHFV